MTIKTINKVSRVHGRIKRTYIYGEAQDTDRDVHKKMVELSKGKNSIGAGFFGNWAYFEVKRRWWQL